MEKRLILRTVDKDRKSYGGFVWPELGYVEATDWQPTESCGNGLHGFLWGEGDGSLADWSESAKWIVAEIIGEHIDLGGKVKFRAATVLFCGERIAATDFLAKSGAAEKAIIGGTATAGYGGTATAGDGGTVVIKFWDVKRYRLAIGYVGEDIKANTKYRADAKGRLIEA